MSFLLWETDISFIFFFFFQAEDGIRDWSVTGVQTCALPISQLHVAEGTDVALNRIAVVVPARVKREVRVSLTRSEEHTSELQSLTNLVCRLLLEKKNRTQAGTEPTPYQL